MNIFEFDASRRVLAGLEHDNAKSALFWAAMTSTVATIASSGQLLSYVIRLFAAWR